MAHENTPEGLDVGEIVAIVRRRIWLLVIPTLLSAVAGLAVAFLQTPVYEATTIIELPPTVPFTSEMQGLVRIPGVSERLSYGERVEYAAALKNEITARSVIRHLATTTDLSGLIEQKERTRLLAIYDPGDSIGRQEAELQYIQSLITASTKVKWVAKDQLEVTFASSKNSQARDLLSRLADRFIEERVIKDLEMARSSLNFADVQLKRYEEELKSSTEEQARLEKELLSLRTDPSITAEGNLAAITDVIESAKSDISTLGGREAALQERLSDEFGFQKLRVDQMTSEALSRLQTELANSASQLGELAKRYEWNDPRIVSLRVQENDLLARTEDESERIIARQYASYKESDRALLAELLETHTHLTYLKSKNSYLQSTLVTITTKYQRIPDYELQLKQVQQKITAITDLRDRFRRQQESSIITQDVISTLSVSRARIVEPPKLPLTPVSPKKANVFIIALLLGFTIGITSLVVVQVLDRSFYNVDDVRKELDLEVLSVVPAVPYLRDVSKALPGK